MFYKTVIKDRIRVSPDLFGVSKEEAVLKMVKKKYDGYTSQDLGFVVDVSTVQYVGEGIIIPGDGAAYFDSEFTIINFKPEMQELSLGRVRDILDFGAFLTIGPIEGMIHLSQSMDDYVSFSKEKTLQGRDSKRSLKIGDLCRARVVAVSYKDLANPKIALTMRQVGLGKLDWIPEDIARGSQRAERPPGRPIPGDRKPAGKAGKKE